LAPKAVAVGVGVAVAVAVAVVVAHGESRRSTAGKLIAKQTLHDLYRQCDLGAWH
jgi:hypothetical protein